MKITIKIDGHNREIELPASTVDALKSLADRNGLTIEQMLEQAIANELYIEDTLAAGDEILVGSGDKFRRLELA